MKFKLLEDLKNILEEGFNKLSTLEPQKKCPVCHATTDFKWIFENDIYQFLCLRCGKYKITGSLMAQLQNELPNKRLILSSYLREQYERGYDIFLSTYDKEEIIQIAFNKKPASFAEKIYKLLVAIENLEEYYMEPISSGKLYNKYRDVILTLFKGNKNIDTIRRVLYEIILPYFSAMSYSINSDEVVELIKNGLKPLGYVKAERGIFSDTSTVVEPEVIQITPKGYEKIEELKRKIGSETRKVFIAMPFKEDDENLQKLYLVIQEVLTSLGYIPVRVDKIDYTGYIIDKIMSEIRGCRFVICILNPETGSDHINLNVMFEYGYAYGLGKNVIPVCHKDFEKKMPFDIKQFNTIFYTTEEELKERLKNRIRNIYGKVN